MDTDRELKLLRDLEALVVVRDNQRAKIERLTKERDEWRERCLDMIARAQNYPPPVIDEQ